MDEYPIHCPVDKQTGRNDILASRIGIVASCIDIVASCPMFPRWGPDGHQSKNDVIGFELSQPFDSLETL